MSISLTNSRDQISFTWSGNASDDAIFTDLSTGSTVSIKPFSHWSQGSYYYPLAIAKGTRAIHGSNWTWGIDGLFSTIHRQNSSSVQWRHWLANNASGDAWNGATNTSQLSSTKGIEEYYLTDIDGNDLINDYSYYVITPNLEINEGDSGSITITRQGSDSWTHTLNLQSSGISASSSDFTAINQTITFTPGETSKTISISTIDDNSVESDETFKLTLTSSSNYAHIGSNQNSNNNS